MKELQENEKSELLRSLWFPLFLAGILWLVHIFESLSGIDLSPFGLVPLDLKGIRGILFMPFIHGSWQHLVNNTIPVFVLSWALFYFYRTIAFKVFFLTWFIHGFWLWFLGRESYHIGASGIIYGLGSFIFASGIIRRNTHLLAISLLVAFLYGSMVWGIFPYEEHISWEGHLTGLVAGLILAFYYKDYGPSANLGQGKDEGIQAENEDGEELEISDDEVDWKNP